MQSLILKESQVLGKIPVPRFLQDDLKEIVLPVDILLDPANDAAEAPHSRRYHIKSQMNDFNAKIAEVSRLLTFPVSVDTNR